MIDIIKRLRGKTATSVDLRTARDGTDLDALTNTLDAANMRREALLIEGTDREILSAENDVTIARLALERGKAVKAELGRRIVAAQADEAKAALDAERAPADTEGAAVAAEMGELPKLLARATNMLARAQASNEVNETVNAKLSAAGRGAERTEDAEWRIRAKPEGQFEGAVSPLRHVSLPEVAEWRLDGWRERGLPI